MDPINDTTFSENLRKYRTLRGYKQDELGRMCGLADKYISELESSRKQPSYELARKIAVVLDVSMEQLSYGIDTPTSEDYFVKEALKLRGKMSDKQKKLADRLGLNLLEDISNLPDE